MGIYTGDDTQEGDGDGTNEFEHVRKVLVRHMLHADLLNTQTSVVDRSSILCR